MRLAPWLRALAAAALAAVACTNGGENRILGIGTTGTVTGFALVDANGSRLIDAGDDSLPNAKVRLVLKSGQDAGLVQTTQSNGSYRFPDVPVGEYSLKVDTAGFADTLQVVKVDSQSFTVGASDTVRINALVGIPVLTVRQARATAPGRRVFITGVALASAGAFADTSTSVADTSGSIRVARARAAFAAGDSLRLRGTIGSRNGEPSLDDPVVIALGQGRLPAAPTLTTVVAATAAGGARDAQVVIVNGVTISDTSRTSTAFVLTVSDGSGPLQVQLDFTANPSFQPGSLPGIYIAGNRFDVVGVLAPTGTGSWRLRPRGATDLTLIPPLPITIAAARALPAGTPVNVVGVALNSSASFSDTIVNLADTSGAIRLTRLRANLTVGDSVKVRATTGSRAGQATLDAGTTTALGQGLLPTAATLTTAQAAAAGGGTRDAQVVVIDSAAVTDTATVLDGFRLTVTDGSGNLTVFLDQRAGFPLPTVYVPGNRFRMIGLLVPTGTGTWMLKPRAAADLQTLAPVPPITIAAARVLPPGTLVNVVGVALNSSASFSDTIVNLADTSGAIRLTRLRANLTVGDSVKVRATTGSRAGQPTLDAGTTTALGQGFLPTAATLTTAVAATAAGGTRDAQVVVIDSAAVTDTATILDGFRLTVTDGGGNLTVFLDLRAGFQIPTVYVPGNRFRMIGLLVPTGTGTWMLKPRAAADLQTLAPVPPISIRAARARPAGTLVNVVGVALNGSAAFSDSIVALADTSGAIRLTRLRATVAAGDSVRVRATTASRAGQPTLDAGTVIPLGTGLFPTAPTVTTQVAAAAAGGTLDAQLVIVNGATISDTATVLGAFKLTVTDGSGNLEVLLDQRAGFTVPGVFVPANRFNIVGVLVPTGTGAWRLKPRSAADLLKL